MRILIAEDDPVSRAALTHTLSGWGHEVIVTCDGLAAWTELQRDTAPKLALLDWMMPHVDGAEVCRRTQALARSEPTYLMLVTGRQQKADIVAGLESGANDYVVKPFDRQELKSRIGVGQRVVELQRDLAHRVRQLEQALEQVKQLQGLLPICCYCKKIRDDQNYWQSVETYFEAQSRLQFSHGICPDCFRQIATESGMPLQTAAAVES